MTSQHSLYRVFVHTWNVHALDVQADSPEHAEERAQQAYDRDGTVAFRFHNGGTDGFETVRLDSWKVQS